MTFHCNSAQLYVSSVTILNDETQSLRFLFSDLRYQEITGTSNLSIPIVLNDSWCKFACYHIEMVSHQILENIKHFFSDSWCKFARMSRCILSFCKLENRIISVERILSARWKMTLSSSKELHKTAGNILL
jgi:hypothetical protein